MIFKKRIKNKKMNDISFTDPNYLGYCMRYNPFELKFRSIHF